VKLRDIPFQRHWLYYLALKYALIVLAALVTLYTGFRHYQG
jgi:hypothetical protein